MGQAKRRQEEIATLKARHKVWRESLTPDETAIAQFAERLCERLVIGRRYSGGCYHLAFFMTQYLATKGVCVTPVVGWINDGTWDGIASHAWVEYEEKKTDVSLCYTAHPKANPTGSLIILDHELRKGMSHYSYYHNEHPVVEETLKVLRTRSELDAIRDHKDLEHARMLAIAQNRSIASYLDAAPPGYKYNDLVQLME